MTVLVFGARTNVGAILSRVDGVVAVSEQMADPRRPADCARLVDDIQPIAVINVAAQGNPTLASRQPALTHTINAAMPTALAESCAMQEIPIVHLSSVDVFDGALELPYIPSDPIQSKTGVGRSRIAGELGIQKSGAAHGILRAAPVFEMANVFNDPQFCRRMENDTLLVPNDIITGPVPAYSVAQACIAMAAGLKNYQEKSGTYHYSSVDEVSLSAFMADLAALSGMRLNVQGAPQERIFGRKIWPTNGRLDCRTTKAVFGVDRPDWREAARATTHLQRKVFA